MSESPRRDIIKDRQKRCRGQSSPEQWIRGNAANSGRRAFLDLHQAAEYVGPYGGLRSYFQVPISTRRKKFPLAFQRRMRPARSVIRQMGGASERQCSPMNLAEPRLLPRAAPIGSTTLGEVSDTTMRAIGAEGPVVQLPLQVGCV